MGTGDSAGGGAEGPEGHGATSVRTATMWLKIPSYPPFVYIGRGDLAGTKHFPSHHKGFSIANANMSSSKSYSYSSSSVSYSSSSTNGQTTGSRYAQQTTSNPDGTSIQTASQRSGEPLTHERRDYDSSGRPIVGGNTLGGAQTGRIEDVSDQDRENARMYQERIEDEYAKREGGA